MNSLNSKEAFSFTFKEFILWSRKSSTSNIQKWTSFFFSIYFLNLQENILLLLLLFSRSSFFECWNRNRELWNKELRLNAIFQ
jgi:hypothetical protein